MTLSLASFALPKCDKIFLWTKVCAVKKQALSMEISTFLNFACLVDSIENRYWLNGPEIESRWRRDIAHPSRPYRGPTTLLKNSSGSLFLARSGRVVALKHPPPAPMLKKEQNYTSTPLLDLHDLFQTEI
jgi:hypothetical protein